VNPRRLPRAATHALWRHLGVTDIGPTGWTAPIVLPRLCNHDSGTGEGGAGGSGDAGEGDDDGAGSGKSLAEMSDAEQAAFWKKQARLNERKLKAAPKTDELEQLRTAAAELEKIRDAQRSDQEKAVARADKAEAELAELRPKLVRLQVATDKGLPPKLAARLVGSTQAELEADADALLAEFGDTLRGDTEAQRRTAARKGTAADAGVRGTRDDSRPSVTSGADLWAQRHPTKNPS
jgi:hypothetical protein